MSMYGKDHEYANSRLMETVVKLEGEPVYVANVVRGMLATYCSIKDMHQFKTCPVDDLDLKPVKLGYLNHPARGLNYLMRIPKRNDWRQGLRFGNFTGLGFDVRHLRYEDLYDVIKGNYSTYAQALAAIKGKKVGSQAWCREWAMIGALLVYKGTPVGKIIAGKPVLDEQNHYLREALEEVL